jgi:hypothetical protein
MGVLCTGLQRIEDAVRSRRRVLAAFELAERADDPAEQRRRRNLIEWLASTAAALTPKASPRSPQKNPLRLTADSPPCRWDVSALSA